MAEARSHALAVGVVLSVLMLGFMFSSTMPATRVLHSEHTHVHADDQDGPSAAGVGALEDATGVMKEMKTENKKLMEENTRLKAALTTAQKKLSASVGLPAAQHEDIATTSPTASSIAARTPPATALVEETLAPTSSLPTASPTSTLPTLSPTNAAPPAPAPAAAAAADGAYYMGDKGKLCKLGHDAMSEQDCKAGAIDLKLGYAGPFSGGGDHPFCMFAADGREKVFFNSHPGPGPAKADYKSVCKTKAAAAANAEPDAEVAAGGAADDDVRISISLGYPKSAKEDQKSMLLKHHLVVRLYMVLISIQTWSDSAKLGTLHVNIVSPKHVFMDLTRLLHVGDFSPKEGEEAAPRLAGLPALTIVTKLHHVALEEADLATNTAPLVAHGLTGAWKVRQWDFVKFWGARLPAKRSLWVDLDVVVMGDLREVWVRANTLLAKSPAAFMVATSEDKDSNPLYPGSHSEWDAYVNTGVYLLDRKRLEQARVFANLGDITAKALAKYGTSQWPPEQWLWNAILAHNTSWSSRAPAVDFHCHCANNEFYPAHTSTSLGKCTATLHYCNEARSLLDPCRKETLLLRKRLEGTAKGKAYLQKFRDATKALGEGLGLSPSALSQASAATVGCDYCIKQDSCFTR